MHWLKRFKRKRERWSPIIGFNDTPIGSGDISAERIRQIIAVHDSGALGHLGGLSFYAAHMRMILENEGIDLGIWDWSYTDDDRREAYERLDQKLKEHAIQEKQNV